MSIMPGSMLGLLGGGQLGRMFTMAAQSMGYQVTVLDPAVHSPAGCIADRFICADYDDEIALLEMGVSCEGVTTEFENVPADSLNYLANHAVVCPGANSIAVAQDRITEKHFLATHGFSIAEFVVIENSPVDSSTIHSGLFPGILKISRFGYDGKGQIQVNNIDELNKALTQLNGSSFVLEQLLPLKNEISIIVARGFDGITSVFPAVENLHTQGILDVSILPARLSETIIQQANETAVQVAEKLNYQGVLCIEFFVLTNGELLINEIAPRPHNSGHATLDACVTSQFEQQVRILCGLPLGDTHQHSAAVMVNLLGDLWQPSSPDWNKILQHPSAKLHLYGKNEARPGRKMGHFTVLGSSTEAALQQALSIKQSLLEP